MAATTDWHRVLTPDREQARDIYDRFVAPAEPVSPIQGVIHGVPFSVSRDDLRAVWRERRTA